MNNKTRDIVFKIFAALSVVVLLYHVAGTVQTIDDSPAWHHVIFVGVSTVCIYGLLKRPKWFIWFFGALTVQQLYSHGSHALQLLKEYKINTVDLAVALLLPLVFVLLLVDRRATK
ncbi:MAG: hypothetical protein JST86_16500 [Bacteroidetes bacterium]|nr:hypothetical protein [Bacteroidota bacterium]